MKLRLPDNIDDLEDWLSDDTAGVFPLNDNNIQIAHDVALAGWRARAAERMQQRPEDLSSACKFSTLFVKALFGGMILGNEEHQYNVIDSQVFDLNKDANDVRNMTASGVDPYEHDPSFFGNEEHLDALLSCIPRVANWVEVFEMRVALSSAPINRLAP
jgi:hypothetical protein